MRPTVLTAPRLGVLILAMAEHDVIRLLDDPPLDGPTNMARDEALLELVGRSQSPPTLRTYQWKEPTISLGYFQAYADYENLPTPAGRLPVVRRLTGGGAILHDQELTYALVLPSDHAMLTYGPNRLYEMAHQAVIDSLDEIGAGARTCGESDDSGAARGPFFCFERRHRYDVLAGNQKIAGSAQRRRRHAILQHGSIILANRFEQQNTAIVSVPYDRACEQIRKCFGRRFGEVAELDVESGKWSSEELAKANDLTAKYRGAAWTRRS